MAGFQALIGGWFWALGDIRESLNFNTLPNFAYCDLSEFTTVDLFALGDGSVEWITGNAIVFDPAAGLAIYPFGEAALAWLLENRAEYHDFHVDTECLNSLSNVEGSLFLVDVD